MTFNEKDNTFIRIYKDFRRELDELCIPLILKELPRLEPITVDGEVVGMIGGFASYIDCLYVKPEFRRRGLAREAALKFTEGKLGNCIRLHIINTNKPAYAFWSSVFKLEEIESNIVDTLYEIVGYREGVDAE